MKKTGTNTLIPGKSEQSNKVQKPAPKNYYAPAERLLSLLAVTAGDLI